jgi:hypothetical protein
MSTKPSTNEITAQNIRALVDELPDDITLDVIGLKAGFSQRTFARRMTGRSDWSLNELDAVAGALGVGMDRLVAREMASSRAH